MGIINYIDVIIVVTLAILFYQLLKKTEALKIMLGIFFIFIFSIIAKKIGLYTTANVLNWATSILMYGVVVLFYPELRMALKKIGGITTVKQYQKDNLIEEINKAVFNLSRRRVGALIVFDPNKTISYQSENLTSVDSKCKREIIETIFHPNTPLHDGAVIIQNNRIAFAGCKLKLSGRRVDGAEKYGTRHLVAIETAEDFDTTIIVVSEETGNVSIVTKNGLQVVKTPEEFNAHFPDTQSKLSWFEKLKIHLFK